jgi:hypothetical protein
MESKVQLAEIKSTGTSTESMEALVIYLSQQCTSFAICEEPEDLIMLQKSYEN